MSETRRTPAGASSSTHDTGLKVTEVESRVGLYRIAYEEGQRALDDQRDELKSIRDRAVSFTAFVGAATAFLVGTGLKTGNRDIVFYVLAGVASALSTVFILLLLALLRPWKKKPWHYRLEPTKLITGWIDTEIPIPIEARFIRELAETYDGMQAQNEDLLGSLRNWFRWLILVGAAQVTVWAALVWAKG
jgi:hypothetical protein